MHTEEIRRRSNGTIDIDFYRGRAATLRLHAQQGAWRKLGRAIGAPAARALIVLAGAMMAAQQPKPPLL
jgi:hypothetical protein